MLNEQKEVLDEFLLRIFKSYKDSVFDLQLFVSFLSILFKKNLGSDVLVQQFEVYFCREIAYKIKSFDELINEIGRADSAKKWQVFKEIADVLSIFIKNHEVDSVDDKIAGIIDELGDLIVKNIDTSNGFREQQIQPSFDDFEKCVDFHLTPTSGIRMLNNNPYEFFVRKILHLNSLGEWENDINGKLYGTIIHKIMENFAKSCRREWITKEKINVDLFRKSRDYVLQDCGIGIDDFLKFKLARIGDIAVKMEQDAYMRNCAVLVEKKVGCLFRDIKIEAVIDRLEVDAMNRKIFIYDFKTGNLPTKADETNGVKVQLLIIAFIISNLSEYSGYSIEKMSYIDLSGKDSSKNVEIGVDEIPNTEGRLAMLLEKFFKKLTSGKIVPIIDNMHFVGSSTFNMHESDKELMRFVRCAFV